MSFVIGLLLGAFVGWGIASVGYGVRAFRRAIRDSWKDLTL